MKVDKFSPEFHSLPSFRLSGWSDVEELFEFRDAFLHDHPGQQMLFVLDDSAQAGYQSGHAQHKHGLAPHGDALDLTTEQRAVWEEDQIAPAEIYSAFVVNAIRSKLDNEFKIEKRIHLELSDVEFFECLEDESRIFASPLRAATVFADETSMGIAAYPNGYFADDLSPMQNYLLAELLKAEFGIELFGLGSFLAGFVSADPFTKQEAQAIVSRVRGLLYEMSDEAADKWTETTAGQRWFVLSYVGGS